MPAIAAQKPANETARLNSLEQLRLLDTLPEQVYDDLALLASYICETPISLVSLIDSERQWFKAKLGLSTPQTPRDQSFCSHALLAPADVFTVADTLADSRFSDNQLVTGRPHIRFYAGAPIVTDKGHALGTVCAIDIVPRVLSAKQLFMLQALARQAAALFQLRARTFAAESAVA